MSKVFNTSLRFTDIIIGQAIRAYSTMGACTHLSLLYRTKISSTVGGIGKWPEKLNSRSKFNYNPVRETPMREVWRGPWQSSLFRKKV